MSDPLQGSNGPDLTLGTPVDSLADGVPLLGHVGSSAIILVRRADAISAIGATCGHYGGPLAEGLLVDDTVRCPWHHACFSLRTGEALRAPALSPVSLWSVERKNGKVFVRQKMRESAKAASRAPSRPPDRIVIVGGGAAGFAAAEMLRRERYRGELVMLSDDRAAPVDRPNLSKDYLAGTAAEDWVPLRPDSFYPEAGIKLRLSAAVVAIEPRSHNVVLGN